MKGVLFMPTERMTWDVICNKYPNHPVGLSDVEWDNGMITSAIVLYNGSNYSKSEMAGIAALSDGHVYCENTTPESLLSTGIALLDA